MARDALLDTKHDIWVHLAYFTTFLTQCIIDNYISTQMAKSPVPKASCSDEEVMQLVSYLYEYCNEGPGGGAFKPSVINRVVTHITPFLKLGPAKTVKMVRNKWASVSTDTIPLVQLSYPNFIAMKDLLGD